MLLNISVGGIIPPKPSDYVKSLVSGLPSSQRGQRGLMILQTVIDDSGSSQREPYYALGGFISTYDNWAKFADAWQLELDRQPSIKCFKMRQAFAAKGPFEGWKSKDIDDRLQKLLEIIKSHAMIRVFSAMKRKDYDEIIKGKVFDEIDQPYFILFYRLIYAIAEYQRIHKWNVQNDFIFDEQGKMGLNTVKWFHIMKREMPQNIKSYVGSPPIFRDDEKFLPLQAADLYVWAIRRNLYENKILIVPIRPELKYLYDMKSIELYFNREDLLKMEFMESFHP